MSDFSRQLDRLARDYWSLITKAGACAVQSEEFSSEERVEFQRNFHARKSPDSPYDARQVRKMNVRAISSCISCPVRQQCLEYSLIAHEPASIWGGYKDSLRTVLISTATSSAPDLAPVEWTEESWADVLALFEEADTMPTIPYRKDAPSKRLENLYAKLTINKKRSAE